jgi:hypothetical protein
MAARRAFGAKPRGRIGGGPGWREPQCKERFAVGKERALRPADFAKGQTTDRLCRRFSGDFGAVFNRFLSQQPAEALNSLFLFWPYFPTGDNGVGKRWFKAF